MPHNHIGLNSKRRQQPHHSNIGRKHRGLCHFGAFNSGFALGNLFFGFTGFTPHGIGQVLANDVYQKPVCFIKCILHHFIFRGQVFHHVHILRTLAREHKAYFGLNFRRRKRINGLHTQVQRVRCPYILFGRNFLKKFNFLFEFFRVFHIDCNRKMFRFGNVVLIGNTGQIRRVYHCGQGGLIQHVVQFFSGIGRES